MMLKLLVLIVNMTARATQLARAMPFANRTRSLDFTGSKLVFFVKCRVSKLETI